MSPIHVQRPRYSLPDDQPLGRRIARAVSFCVGWGLMLAGCLVLWLWVCWSLGVVLGDGQ